MRHWAGRSIRMARPGVAQYFVTIPPTTLGELAKTLQTRLHAQTMRVDGDPKLPITHVALIPGAGGLEKHVRALNVPGVDVLIAGEASEWESVEYVRDAVAQGRGKSMILLGHEVSEEPAWSGVRRSCGSCFRGSRWIMWWRDRRFGVRTIRFSRSCPERLRTVAPGRKKSRWSGKSKGNHGGSSLRMTCSGDPAAAGDLREVHWNRCLRVELNLEFCRRHFPN